MVRLWLFLVVCSVCSLAAEVETIVLPARGDILRAEVLVWRAGNSDGGLEEKATERLGRRSLPGYRGVLVFCPGQNGSSEGALRSKVWQDFAEREGLALVGFRFVSADEDLKNGKGYFVASRGAGELLEAGLRKAGLGGVPLFLYGFSGGAHFAMSFAAWRPEHVTGFCAYSFAWWSPPPEKLQCPALIVCGQADGVRYGSTLSYFQAGRKQGKPWAWVSLKETAHATSAELDGFVREYFSSVMNSREGKQLEAASILADNTTEKVVKERTDDVSSSVLPCADLWPKWREIHHP